jgi:hypothetical protein
MLEKPAGFSGWLDFRRSAYHLLMVANLPAWPACRKCGPLHNFLAPGFPLGAHI